MEIEVCQKCQFFNSRFKKILRGATRKVEFSGLNYVIIVGISVADYKAATLSQVFVLYRVQH